jgi:hypothetical protein
VSLLWAVPVVAVAVGAALVLARARTIEDASVGLAVAVRRTGELRRPLADLRDELDRSGPLVDRVWSHWDPDDDPETHQDGADPADHAAERGIPAEDPPG